MPRMTAAQAVAQFLKRVGTKRYYLYNGHANWGLLDALEYEAKIPGIRMRHEIHAVHAADIEWRMRRALPIPVTCTTVGPGNFNTIPGIAEVFFDSTPMLCLMAGGPTKWYGRGGIQEIYRYGDDEFVLRGQGNVYFWYYGSLCCFLAGGDAWTSWNERLRSVLPKAQEKDGSFLPIDTYAREAGDTRADRSYTTAMCVLSLEVYYRYFTPLLLGR